MGSKLLQRGVQQPPAPRVVARRGRAHKCPPSRSSVLRGSFSNSGSRGEFGRTTPYLRSVPFVLGLVVFPYALLSFPMSTTVISGWMHLQFSQKPLSPAQPGAAPVQRTTLINQSFAPQGHAQPGDSPAQRMARRMISLGGVANEGTLRRGAAHACWLVCDQRMTEKWRVRVATPKPPHRVLSWGGAGSQVEVGNP